MPRDRRLEAAFDGFAAAVLTDEELALLDAVRSIVRPDATLRAEVVGQAAPQIIPLDIAGVAANGTNVAFRRRLPADAIITRIDADAKTAPSGGEFTAQLTANGASVSNGAVSIAAGTTSGGSNVNTAATGGVWLGLNVTADNGAANIAVTVTYRVV